jgi:hypothetical protein
MVFMSNKCAVREGLQFMTTISAENRRYTGKGNLFLASPATTVGSASRNVRSTPIPTGA